MGTESVAGLEAHLTALWSLLAVAVAADVAQRRIPNVVVLTLAAAGIAAQWVGAGPVAALQGALTGAGVLALLVIPWASGKVGGGDVKLIAATAIWIGPSRVLVFLALTAVAGAPVALLTRLVHVVESRRMVRDAAGGGIAFDRPALPVATVPYAAAVAIGAFAAFHGGLR